MASGYRLISLANGDLEEIAYTIEKENPGAAMRMLVRFEATFEQLAHMPRMGRARPEYGEGLRTFPLGPYIIVYHIDDDQVTIVRVIHGSRDIRAMFDEEAATNQTDSQQDEERKDAGNDA